MSSVVADFFFFPNLPLQCSSFWAGSPALGVPFSHGVVQRGFPSFFAAFRSRPSVDSRSETTFFFSVFVFSPSKKWPVPLSGRWLDLRLEFNFLSAFLSISPFFFSFLDFDISSARFSRAFFETNLLRLKVSVHLFSLPFDCCEILDARDHPPFCSHSKVRNLLDERAGQSFSPPPSFPPFRS